MSQRLLLGLAALFTLLVVPAWGLNLQEEIQKEKALLAESAKRERDLLQTLEDLAQKIEAKRQKIEEIQEEIARREIELRALQRELAAKDRALKELEALFQKRLETLARTGRLGWLNLLFAPGDIPTTLRRSTYFQILLAHDQNLARTLQKEKRSLAQEKALLLQEKKHLSELNSLEEKEVASLEALRREKEALLEEVRHNITLYRETLENLVQAYQTLQKLANELQDTKKKLQSTTAALQKAQSQAAFSWPSPYKMKGLMLPPVEGVVQRFFGLFQDPITGKNIFQPGIFIAAPAGTPVRSPYTAKLVKIRLLPGQGLFVFLDHGYDFLSIIGGLGKVEIPLGTIIKTGTVLGKVGELPFSKAGVYYELRFRGKPQNPLDWLDTSKLHFLR